MTVDTAKPVSTTPAGSVADTAGTPKVWRVGTLVYTRTALLSVFFWMLWGDFCLTIMESVIPRLVPLQLKDLGVSSGMIGLLVGSIPSGMNFVMNPIISTRSDRHRGPLGRRMPYLLWPTPLLALCLVLVGFSADIAGLLHGAMGPLASVVSERQLAIAAVGFFTILFTFFNLFITSVYYYLFTDVIPQELMGKFTCLFRVVGACGGIVFNRWILGYAEHHAGAIYVGTGLMYMTAFLLLVWRVREGGYPPPEPVAARGGGKGGPLAAVRGYVTECFSVPFYLKLYAVGACYWVATVPFTTFVVFYATKTLGMDLDGFGKILSWTGIATLPLFFVLGPLVDRFHPLRVVIVGLVATAAAAGLSFVFVHDARSFLTCMVAYFVATAVYMGGSASMLPRLLPRERYGQFCSANAMATAVGLVVAPWACGAFLDVAADYRYVFVWASCWAAVGAVAAVAVYRHWRRLGGDQSYVPPASD